MCVCVCVGCGVCSRWQKVSMFVMTSSSLLSSHSDSSTEGKPKKPCWNNETRLPHHHHHHHLLFILLHLLLQGQSGVSVRQRFIKSRVVSGGRNDLIGWVKPEWEEPETRFQSTFGLTGRRGKARSNFGEKTKWLHSLLLDIHGVERSAGEFTRLPRTLKLVSSARLTR